MDLLSILAFVGLIGGAVWLMFRSWGPQPTFTRDELDAFDRAEQVKKDLAAVQAKVNPAKAPYILTLSGSEFSKKPDPPAS